MPDPVAAGHGVSGASEFQRRARGPAALARHTVDSIPQHLAVLGRGGRILFVNRAWREFGAARGGRSSLGCSYLSVCRETRGPDRDLALTIADAIERLFAGRIDEYRADYSMSAAGETTHWSVNFNCHREGARTRVVSLHENRTDELARIYLIEAALAAAEQSERAMSRLLAAASHDLRTPLNAVVGFSELHADDPALSADVRTDMRTIGTAGRALLDRVNRMIQVAALEGGTAPLMRTPVTLERLRDDILRLGRDDRSVSRGPLDVRLESPADLEVSLDRVRLIQSIVGFLPCEGTPESPTLTRLAIDVATSGDSHGLRVRIDAPYRDSQATDSGAFGGGNGGNRSPGRGGFSRQLSVALLRRMGGRVEEVRREGAERLELFVPFEAEDSDPIGTIPASRGDATRTTDTASSRPVDRAATERGAETSSRPRPRPEEEP